MFKKISMAAVAVSFSASSSFAATNITWWHGMGGRNGEVINEVAQKFNASQSACALTPVSKGTYEEALAAGIAAFRSGEQPNIRQVFDAGAATIINAKGAVVPAEDLIKDAGYKFDRNASFRVFAISTLLLTASSSACPSTLPRRSCTPIRKR